MPHPLNVRGLHIITRGSGAAGPTPERKVGTVCNVVDAWATSRGAAWALVSWPDDTDDVRTATRVSYAVISLDQLGGHALSGAAFVPRIGPSMTVATIGGAA